MLQSSIGDTVTVLGDTIFSQHKWVQVQNIVCMFVVLEYDDISPQFGNITDIVILQETIVFQVHVDTTQSGSQA